MRDFALYNLAANYGSNSKRIALIISFICNVIAAIIRQKLLKLVDPRRSYSVLHQCHCFETQCTTTVTVRRQSS